MIRNWKKEILTIPNLLSLLRLLLIPVYMVIYLNAAGASDYFAAAAILSLSCLTDLVDGKIARRYNMISTVGKILDPIADKATQFTLIVCLAVKHPRLWLLVGLFVVKESFQLIAGLINLRRRKMLPGALMAGKVCTTVLFVSLTTLVLFPNMNHGFVELIALVDVVFLCISFVNYILAYFGKNTKVQDLKSE